MRGCSLQSLTSKNKVLNPCDNLNGNLHEKTTYPVINKTSYTGAPEGTKEIVDETPTEFKGVSTNRSNASNSRRKLINIDKLIKRKSDY